jgi:enoyl-CoA hydratase/carnithine racemase
MTETLLLDRPADGIVVLTFNRPQVMNALDLATMRAFAEAVALLAGDAALRAVILTGAGAEAFCSGGDLVELQGYPTEENALAMITLMGDALLALERLPVPVIAAVNGYALGGGSEIALACDLRVIDQQTRMGMVQVRHGLTPGWGAGQRLLRLVGYARAMDMLLRGRVMRAPEIDALGLANRVVEPGMALAEALNFAREIAQLPPEVVRSIKVLLQAGLNQPYEAALQTERVLFPPLWAADAHLQALNEYLNKTRKNA